MEREQLFTQQLVQDVCVCSCLSTRARIDSHGVVVHLLPEPIVLAMASASPPDLGHRLAARFASPLSPQHGYG